MMKTPQKKAYVAVKSRYYKADAAASVLDHTNARRNGFTRSVNVNPQYSHENAGLYVKGCKTTSEGLEKACRRYKEVTGKKVRTDFNVLFEHVVILTESQYARLEVEWGKERAKRLVLKHLAQYAHNIKAEFGFEPIGVELHLDEGHYQHSSPNGDSTFTRNIHAHVSFFNYCFKRRIAPLRHLLNKQKDKNGRTNQLNPNFVRMQDIAADTFASLGFNRGESMNVTGAKHLKKEEFVINKLHGMEEQVNDLLEKNQKLERKLKGKQNESDLLSQKICAQERKSHWLDKHIEKLQEIASEVERAIKGRCQHALRRLTQRLRSKSSPTQSPK